MLDRRRPNIVCIIYACPAAVNPCRVFALLELGRDSSHRAANFRAIWHLTCCGLEGFSAGSHSLRAPALWLPRCPRRRGNPPPAPPGHRPGLEPLQRTHQVGAAAVSLGPRAGCAAPSGRVGGLARWGPCKPPGLWVPLAGPAIRLLPCRTLSVRGPGPLPLHLVRCRGRRRLAAPLTVELGRLSPDRAASAPFPLGNASSRPRSAGLGRAAT